MLLSQQNRGEYNRSVPLRTLPSIPLSSDTSFPKEYKAKKNKYLQIVGHYSITLPNSYKHHREPSQHCNQLSNSAISSAQGLSTFYLSPS